MASFVLVDNADDVKAVAAPAGELAGALRLLRPVGADHGAQHQRGADELRGQHAAPHPAEVQPNRPERQRQRHGHSHAVERRDVDPRRLLGPRAAAQHAAPGGLRAVAQLGQAEKWQRRGRQPEDGLVRREHPRPDAAHGHRECAGDEAERGAQAEPDARDEARALRPPGAQFVPDARGHGAAERMREDVYQRRGLDEHAHCRHRRLGVDEHAAEEHHDLVPPPLQADGHAAVHAQPDQAPPLLGALLLCWRRLGRALLGAAAVVVMGAVHSAEVDVRHEEQQEVEVGPDPAERDAADAEAEDVDEEEVDGHVEEQRRGGAVGERQRDGLRAQVDADRVEEALHREVREAAEDVGVRRGGDVGVLPRGDEDPVHGHPEHADGHGRGEEQQDGAAERGAEEVRAPGPEGLAADGVHPAGEAGEDGVPGDVGEAEREGAAGEGQLAEAAEEHHGHEGAHVEQDPRADHWPREAEDGGHLGEDAAGRRPRAVVQLRVAGGRREEQRPVVALRRLRAVARRHGMEAVRGLREVPVAAAAASDACPA
ncbi:hypothetical protein GQ55_2G327400 [Panicum hallii var. hallii]|uniref:Uncharacterized protein n=1 Tax=Panicum hallii var. hallii TaxID=1504633 RepID=A0A2T7EUV7_9POAL|nr:hypothetical protein GQ55_2G327400 [Panicum hallii var. hallii]